jgi:DNA-binding transcriptional LysR family regulator
MALETQELASFAVLAEQLHFGRAAARLHISQPALSKRMRSLEEKIGGPLLARNRRGVALTRAGAMFYKESRRIIHDLEAAFEAARGASSGERGKLRLGVGMSTVHSLVPRALVKFRESAPGV